MRAVYLILAVAFTAALAADEETDKNKRGTVGGIVYAGKSAPVTVTAAPVVTKTVSPNVAFSSNTVYATPAPAFAANVAYTAAQPAYTVAAAPQQYIHGQQFAYAPQAVKIGYAQPNYAQQVYSQQLVQPAATYAVSPAQQHYIQPQAYTFDQQQAVKIGYAQPAAAQLYAHQPALTVAHAQQYAHQPALTVAHAQQYAHQPALTVAHQAPAYTLAHAQPLAVAQSHPQLTYALHQPQQIQYAAPAAVKVGYAQPAYAKVAGVQQVNYAAPAVTKVGYAAPVASAPLHYSPAGSVSQFSYSSPNVRYGSSGIEFLKAGHVATAPIAYASAPQPLYAPAPYAKVGYAAPVYSNYAH